MLDLRLHQDVFLTGPLHEKNIAGFEVIQDRPNSASCIAIDGNGCGADLRDRGEAKHKELQEPRLRSQFDLAVGR